MSEIEHFMPLLMQREEEGALAPLLSHGRVHFLWIKHSNLYCIRPQGSWGTGVVAAQAQRGWAEEKSCTAHQWGVELGSGGWQRWGQWWGTGWGFRVFAPFESFQNGTFSLTSLPTVVATTLKNANASLVYSFLYKTVEVGPGLPLASCSVCPPV